jgi:hypothetical protein
MAPPDLDRKKKCWEFDRKMLGFSTQAMALERKGRLWSFLDLKLDLTGLEIGLSIVVFWVLNYGNLLYNWISGWVYG